MREYFVNEIDITTRKQAIRVMNDGELRLLSPPLRYRIRRGALRVLVPALYHHTIAQITDLHFGAEDPHVVASLLEELNGDPPDLIAISGDLTQGARMSEFHAARAFLSQLGAPGLAVPGKRRHFPLQFVGTVYRPVRRAGAR